MRYVHLSLVAGLSLALISAGWATTPKHTIDQVERAATKAGVSRLVGIDFTQQGWDVYHVQSGRVMEWRMSDRDLSIVRREAQSLRLPERHLSFRDALAAVRKAARGTVVSLELEQDEEKGLVWSGVVRQGANVTHVYLHGVNGRVIEVERMSRR